MQVNGNNSNYSNTMNQPKLDVVFGHPSLSNSISLGPIRASVPTNTNSSNTHVHFLIVEAEDSKEIGNYSNIYLPLQLNREIIVFGFIKL